MATAAYANVLILGFARAATLDFFGAGPEDERYQGISVIGVLVAAVGEGASLENGQPAVIALVDAAVGLTYLAAGLVAMRHMSHPRLPITWLLNRAAHRRLRSVAKS
ncbi:MAG TPA: hypothetical protein VF365_06930 [Candidatus Limnocylindria bacterium]